MLVQCGEMWRCKLDDPDTACQPYPADHLHATDEPPPDAPTFTPFAPQVLATDLAAEQVPAYLESLQFDTDDPVDLRRKKPDSEAWFDVLTGRQDIADLPDDDLRQLQYLAAGGVQACWVAGQSLTAPAPPTPAVSRPELTITSRMPNCRWQCQALHKERGAFGC